MVTLMIMRDIFWGAARSPKLQILRILDKDDPKDPAPAENAHLA
jgi:hypothetical protein